jgi:hypothetical protein
MIDVGADAIRERAYQIWEDEGRPHGKDFDHWLRAERELAPTGKAPKRARAARSGDAAAPKRAGSRSKKTH